MLAIEFDRQEIGELKDWKVLLLDKGLENGTLDEFTEADSFNPRLIGKLHLELQYFIYVEEITVSKFEDMSVNDVNKC